MAISPYLARMPNLDANLMVPIVLSVCFVGAYATRGLPGDVIVCAVFGVLGFLMDKYRFSRANFVIGMVLADMIERSLHLSISLYGEFFIFKRPIAFAMFVLIVLTTAWPFVRNWRRRRARPAMVERGPA
jgi:putative tricarboxylic transport membrane protein